MRKIIGVTGNANSGKDTLADYIISNKNNSFVKYALAKPIKDIMIEHLGFTYEQCYDQKLKQIEDDFWGISPREVMLLIGTKMFRENWRYDFWVKLMEKKIIDNSEENIIVSDVRFANEAEMIKSHGGIIVNVKRPNNPIKVNHISENGLSNDLIDYTIINDSTIENYYNKIDKELKDIY